MVSRRIISQRFTFAEIFLNLTFWIISYNMSLSHNKQALNKIIIYNNEGNYCVAKMAK